MHLLLFPTQLLHKAGKQGLIAVQKQVTKKGKTFTQTFYVKPESAPADLDKPKVIKAPEREVIHITTDSGKFEFESNRPEGGFYVASMHGIAVRVPTPLIKKIIKLKGYTFILHRALQSVAEDNTLWKWLGSYRVSELSTGLSVTGAFDTIEEAEKIFKNTIGNKEQKNLDSIIANSTKVADIDQVLTQTSGWDVEDAKQILTDEELETAARDFWMNYFQGDASKLVESWIPNIKRWLKEDENIEYKTDLQEIMEHIDKVGSPSTLAHAITRHLTFRDAMRSIDSIKKVVVELQEIESEIPFHAVAQWAHEYEDDLVLAYSSYDWGLSDEHGDETVSPGDVAHHAIQEAMSLKDAQNYYSEMVEDKDEEPEFESIKITDSYGLDWNYTDIQSISSWVGGVVETTRSLMKDMDGIKRKDIGAEMPSEAIGSIMGKIVNTVESHLVQYDKSILYRGTKNPAWGELNVGDSMPLGIGSFSKSIAKAKNFSGENRFIIVLDDKDMTNPVIGVDIDELLSDIKKAGYSKGVNQHTNLASYETEEEFLVRSPSLIVTKIDSESGIAGIGDYKVIYMKPAEMDMVQFMKSLFEDAILEAERTFDYSLHREPEDAWNW